MCVTNLPVLVGNIVAICKSRHLVGGLYEDGLSCTG